MRLARDEEKTECPDPPCKRVGRSGYCATRSQANYRDGVYRRTTPMTSSAISVAKFNAINDNASGVPILNRAIQGLTPGSTLTPSMPRSHTPGQRDSRCE